MWMKKTNWEKYNLKDKSNTENKIGVALKRVKDFYSNMGEQGRSEFMNYLQGLTDTCKAEITDVDSQVRSTIDDLIAKGKAFDDNKDRESLAFFEQLAKYQNSVIKFQNLEVIRIQKRSAYNKASLHLGNMITHHDYLQAYEQIIKGDQFAWEGRTRKDKIIRSMKD